MDGNKNTANNGIDFAALLFIVFLILKLTNVIDWSWWWVTAPLWIGFVIAILIIIFIFVE